MNIPSSVSLLSGLDAGLRAPTQAEAAAQEASAWFLQAEPGARIAWPAQTPSASNVEALAQRVLVHLLAEAP
jgi:hypothetical protein